MDQFNDPLSSSSLHSPNQSGLEGSSIGQAPNSRPPRRRIVWLVIGLVIIGLFGGVYLANSRGYISIPFLAPAKNTVINQNISINQPTNTNHEASSGNSNVNANSNTNTGSNANSVIQNANTENQNTNASNTNTVISVPTNSSNGNGNTNSTENVAQTDPSGDKDGDGISNSVESGICKTDPNKADTDDDGYNDKTEVDNHYNPVGPGPETSQACYHWLNRN